jgi:hypothetical protein
MLIFTQFPWILEFPFFFPSFRSHRGITESLNIGKPGTFSFLKEKEKKVCVDCVIPSHKECDGYERV